MIMDSQAQLKADIVAKITRGDITVLRCSNPVE